MTSEEFDEEMEDEEEQEEEVELKDNNNKTLKKRKATIEIKNSNYSTDLDEKRKNGTEFISVSFNGYQEGQSSPCDSEEEAQKYVKDLIAKHSDKYIIEIIDKRKVEKQKGLFENKQEGISVIDKPKEITKVENPILTKPLEKDNKEKNTYQEQNIEHFTAEVVYQTDNKLERTERLFVQLSHEMPKGELGSSWGGGESFTNLTQETLKEFEDYLINLKKGYAEKPFTNEIKANPITTTLNVNQNFIIEFSDMAKTYLEKRGFDLIKFNEKCKSVIQKEATQEEITKAKTFDLMEKTLSKLKEECWAIKGFFERVDFLIGVRNYNNSYSTKEYYVNQLKKFSIPYDDLNKLRELYNLKAIQYKALYLKVGEMRWGKVPDEEYAYP